MVSFVVIAYNEAKNIGATLDSILGLEGLESFEIVVINDGSTDKTADIVTAKAMQHPEINLITQQNAGRGAARARGVAAAKGEFIAFIDADIVLPKHWLTTCQAALAKHDGVGGVAVPDGDVAFVHRVFGLAPKPVAPTTTITGNNGFFKRQVFTAVRYNPTKKDGEDVDLVHQLHAAGYKTTTLTDLHVEHHESKSYAESLGWLFVSGRGAARQFYEHKEVRMPDIAFAGLLALLIGLLATMLFAPIFVVPLLGLLALYLVASSAMHLFGKFDFAKSPFKALAAVIVNVTFMAAYYLGRIEGLVSQVKHA